MAEKGLRTFAADGSLQFTTEGKQYMYMGNIVRIHPMTNQSYFVPFTGMIPGGEFIVCFSASYGALQFGALPKVTIIEGGFNVVISPPISDGSLQNNILYDIWRG